MKNSQKPPEDERAKNQAAAQLSSIMKMVNALNADNSDEARETIEQDALSIEIRSNWYTPGTEEKEREYEYTILLCADGPAVRIIGDLDEWKQPLTAHIEYQDWFTVWENYPLNEEQEAAVLQYASCFYFEE